MDKKEKLKIDDQTQMIQGIRISDPDLYKKIRFIVQNNHLERAGSQQNKRSMILFMTKRI